MKLLPHVEQRIIDLAIEGKPVKKILEEIGISATALHEYCENNTAFGQRYSHARNVGYDALAEELLDAHERIHDVQKARLFSENARWLLARRKPSTYGDRLDVNMHTTVDITAALSAAHERAVIPATGFEPVALPLARTPLAAPENPDRDAPLQSPEKRPGRPERVISTFGPTQPPDSSPQRAISQPDAKQSAPAEPCLDAEANRALDNMSLEELLS